MPYLRTENQKRIKSNTINTEKPYFIRLLSFLILFLDYECDKIMLIINCERVIFMAKVLPKRKMYRYCLADIAKGLFTGMISNYLLYFFQPTVKSGLPSLLPENKLLGFITVMALITAIGKVIDAVTDPLVASLSDKCTHKAG